MTKHVTTTIEQIKASHTITIACSNRLSRYFGMLPRERVVKIGGEEYRLLNIGKNIPVFDGRAIQAPADFYFIERKSMNPVYRMLRERTVFLDECENKEEQLMRIAEYVHEFNASPRFKLVPTEIYTRDGCSYSGLAVSSKGYVIKSLNSANGHDQILVRPGKSKDSGAAPDEAFWHDNDSKDALNRIYYHLTNIQFNSPGRRSAPTEDKKNPVDEFVEAMKSYGYDAHANSAPMGPMWLKDAVIQPVLNIKEEYRAFLADNKVVMLQRRPREEGDGYNQLKKCPDIEVDLTNIESGSVEAEFIAELPKFVPDMCSADVFVTNNGEWGVFEFGHGYSPLAAGFHRIAEYFNAFIDKSLRSRIG